jgi:hypothetical protein
MTHNVTDYANTIVRAAKISSVYPQQRSRSAHRSGDQR